MDMTGTWPVGPGSEMTRVSFAVAASQRRRVRSSDAETRVLLSGVNARAVISLTWPVIVASSLPVAASHSRMALSSEPDAISLPSGLTATATTSRVCPWPGAPSLPTSSHTLTVLSTLADTR
jgi:hypothetical protein